MGASKGKAKKALLADLESNAIYRQRKKAIGIFIIIKAQRLALELGALYVLKYTGAPCTGVMSYKAMTLGSMDAVAGTENNRDVEVKNGPKETHSPAVCGEISVKDQKALKKAIWDAMLLPHTEPCILSYLSQQWIHGRMPASKISSRLRR